MSKNNDIIGSKTLDVISASNKFNLWMFATIEKFINKNNKILELGSGIGNISQYFIENNYNISLSDIDDGYIEKLTNKYTNKILKIDIANPNFTIDYKHIIGTFDVVYSLNVIEHIKDDKQAIINAKSLLKPNGKLITLVPAFNFLYNSFDLGLNHYRRYNKATLNSIIDNANLKIINTFYFNAFGTIGWFIFGNILKREVIPEGKMSFYNKLVPFIKFIDKVLFNSFGLSVINVSLK